MPDQITAPAIEQYLAALSPTEDTLLREVETHARQHRLPIVGPVEGRLLFVLARLSGARRILELGCCTGYSALWLAEATEPFGGTIETVELDPWRAEIAAAHFQRSRHPGRITLRRGNALDILPSLGAGQYDLIFNDLLRSVSGEVGSVPTQLRFLELTVPLLRSGGLLLTDNVLCSGQVAAAAPAGTAAGIASYNQRIMAHPALDSALVPIRDGVAISRKR